ncbi:MAG TPA: SDR family oxidoreductase [Acidisarcina sp.]|nr:SDR family oxidoreductase [Acidisarcina sp.]
MDDFTSAFHSQVAVVTGATRGIGEAIAHRLAAMKMTVVLLARDRDRLEVVREAIASKGGSADVFPCDLHNEEAIDGLGKHIRLNYARCDVLVNCAGIGELGKPLHEMEVEDWDALMATNLRAPFLMIRALAPMMIQQESGHIINISSLAGKNPLPNGAAYSASKWGLNGLTYSVAEELRKFNIRVSVVAPGSVNTGFGGRGDSGSFKDEAWKVQPDDVAGVVEMLVRQAPQCFISEVLVRPTRKL